MHFQLNKETHRISAPIDWIERGKNTWCQYEICLCPLKRARDF